MSRYKVDPANDVVTLTDTDASVVVRILTTARDAYQMTARGEDVLRREWDTLEDIRGRMGLNERVARSVPCSLQCRA